MCNIIVKKHKGYLIYWKKVEIDTVATGSHRETKREIDYTQIVALWKILCPFHILTPWPKSKLSHMDMEQSCTAQPTVAMVCSSWAWKRLRDDTTTDRNDGIITFSTL